MPLKSLLDKAQLIRSRISEHRQELSRSEALTRYALVDPLLRALDWNTEDPSQVVPEYSDPLGRADYALLNVDGRPFITIEAKKLGERLEKAAMQGIQYTLQKGIPYFVVTDGQRWHVYETHKRVPLNEKRIVSFDLLESISEACRNALAIWRPGVLEERLQPVPQLPGSVNQPQSRAEQNEPLPPATSTKAEIEGSISLPALIRKMKNGENVRLLGVRFPDESTVEIRYWWHLLREIVRWLAHHGHLKEHACPIALPGATKRSLVDTKPIHPSGKGFTLPAQVGSFHISTHGSSATMVRNTECVIRQVNMDPERFQLELGARKPQ